MGFAQKNDGLDSIYTNNYKIYILIFRIYNLYLAIINAVI